MDKFTDAELDLVERLVQAHARKARSIQRAIWATERGRARQAEKIAAAEAVLRKIVRMRELLHTR